MYTHTLTINDQVIEASYTDTTITDVVEPLLNRMHALKQAQAYKNRPLIVLLAAYPGCGKSTFARFISTYAQDTKTNDFPKIQDLGMDGFHFSNEYLSCHHIDDDPQKPCLRSIKGALPTFDISSLLERLRALKEGTAVKWPSYSRQIHDPLEGTEPISADIIFLEGNYVLCNEGQWKEVGSLADLTLFMSADIELLRARVVARKVMGGFSRKEAQTFFDSSDLANIQYLNSHRQGADIELELEEIEEAGQPVSHIYIR